MFIRWNTVRLENYCCLFLFSWLYVFGYNFPWMMGYSLRTQSPDPPPLHLKNIMTFILRLAKKENIICVSSSVLGDVVMIATNWLLSLHNGRDKQEHSVGAAMIHILFMFAFFFFFNVCLCVCVCHGDIMGVGTLVVSWHVVEQIRLFLNLIIVFFLPSSNIK